MSWLLLLLLVGTIYAQEPENAMCDDPEETAHPECPENSCDLDQGDLENCHNLTIELKNGPENPDICPGKETCTYRVFACARNFCAAQQACRCSGGNLASIPNAWSNNQVLCQARGTVANVGWAWIGVSRSGCNGYRNVNGGCLSYTNFAPGQIQNCGTWCVAMNLGGGQWYSWNCATAMPFVCVY